MIQDSSHVHVTLNFGHPWDQRPGFDLLEIQVDTQQELDQLIAQAHKEFWHTWIAGRQNNTFRAALYQPHGIDQEWIDEPKQPFDATSFIH